MCSCQPTVELGIGVMENIIFAKSKHPRPQFDDNCTCGNIPFPMNRDFTALCNDLPAVK